MTDLNWWRMVLIGAAAAGQSLFVLLYMTFPWYRTFLGRALFIKALTFSLLLDAAFAGRLWDWPHEDKTIIVLYGLTVFGIWAQFTAFAVHRFAKRDQDSTARKREYHHGTAHETGDLHDQPTH